MVGTSLRKRPLTKAYGRLEEIHVQPLTLKQLRQTAKEPRFVGNLWSPPKESCLQNIVYTIFLKGNWIAGFKGSQVDGK